jgi:hypothetical protein
MCQLRGGLLEMSQPSHDPKASTSLPLLLVAGIFLIYYVSNPLTGEFYDYTLRIASALLQGRLGETEAPPTWLSEMIPHKGQYYSAFPLGSVLTMLPLAVLKKLGLVQAFPGVTLAALSASISAYFLYLLSAKYQDEWPRRLVLILFPLLGTWMWANLAFAGAWHVALGIAVAAQLGALYFTLIRFNPLAAGFCFALAFGNRTEILLLAPLFYYLLYRHCQPPETQPRRSEEHEGKPHESSRSSFFALFLRGESFVSAAIGFSLFPFLLGVATLAYNYARFGSPLDFGYARIPGVLQEPWYAHGIFSLHAIPLNFEEMLLKPWKRIHTYPYLVPTGFGGSILLSSPYLLFLFRRGAKDAALKWLAWAAITVLTFVLWCHGNPGGWQFSYRYAMVLLPWMFVVLLESSPKKVSWLEAALFVVSVAISGWGTYLFLRTEYMRP